MYKKITVTEAAPRLRQARRRAKNLARRTFCRLRDGLLPAYGRRFESGGELARLVPAGIRLPLSRTDEQAVRHFLEHRFDLLGSGWVRVHHGMTCIGFEGARFEPPHAARIGCSRAALAACVTRPNRAVAREVRSMLSEGYEPIDWQLDFKSGYRWSERTWYRDVSHGTAEGSDVKLPWELSRMQHLPELALAFARSRDERIVTEFRDQVLDWIAANPPRFGVNWACTMDVSIRVANWVLAFDLLCAAGARFDTAFANVFAAAVADHAQHIVANLEWSETRRGNHYLANVSGLLFAGAYLPAGRRTDAWLAFAIQELMVETDRQFLADGGHFEASTSYHNLCAEMLAICAALLRALPEARVLRLFRVASSEMRYGPKLSPRTSADLQRNYETTGTLLSTAFHTKLALAAGFARSLTRPDGSLVQIGDNDSGRFIRLGGWVEAGSVAEQRARCANLSHFTELSDDYPYVAQAHSSHQQWLAWASAVLGRPELLDAKHSDVWSAALALASELTRGSAQPTEAMSAPLDIRTLETPQGAQPLQALQLENITHRRSDIHRVDGRDLLTNAQYERYPHFGMYVVRSDRLYLTVRCGFARHDGAGVHAHEDQLSVDLTIDGRSVVADPGTYVYTSSRLWRNRYRSAHAHCAPAIDGPAESTAPEIFSAPTSERGECLTFGPDGFVGTTRAHGGPILRRICFHSDRIEIHDEYSLHPSCTPASVILFKPAAPVTFSPGYGIRLK